MVTNARLSRLPVAVLVAVFLAIGLSMLTPRAAHATTDLWQTQCTPALSGTAFPYWANQWNGTPPGCGPSFAWGYTVSGSPTGSAQWDSPFYTQNYGGYPWYDTYLSCRPWAWIPDNHAGAHNAQYFFFDGNHYLGNNAFINQDIYSNQWVLLSDYWVIHDHLRVTLNDQDPMGNANQLIGADAMQFNCIA